MSFHPRNIGSKFKIGERVIVICEYSREYGIEGYVEKTGFSEVQVRLQCNYSTWFGDNRLERIPPKKDVKCHVCGK